MRVGWHGPERGEEATQSDGRQRQGQPSDRNFMIQDETDNTVEAQADGKDERLLDVGQDSPGPARLAKMRR